MVQKLVPLCSSQYERQFNTIRIPGKESGRSIRSLSNSYSISFSFQIELFTIRTVIILLFIIKVVGIKFSCSIKIIFSNQANFNCTLIQFEGESFLFVKVSFFLITIRQLDEIVRDSTPPSYGEEHLAALTAGDRTSWAEARETYFRAAPNRTSLEAIEKAAFVLALDDEEYEIGLVSVKILLNKKKTENLKLISTHRTKILW